MKIFKLNNLTKTDIIEFNNFISKSKIIDKNKIKIVKDIINDVINNGDESLINYTNKFDQCNFKNYNDLIYSDEEIDDNVNKISDDLKKALELSYKRIYDYHQKQLPSDIFYEDEIGVKLGNKWQAIEKIAVYAPGGSASYPSSVLMCAVPAIVAGVKDIILLNPCPKKEINPAILYAAKLCNISKIYKIGGAQAIAAAAYGTKTITKVDKIVGPGNSFVAIAKKEVFGDVGIDMIAGPTDLTIIVEKNLASESWIAIDALSQLEHGADSKVIIITDCKNYANNILMQINEQKKDLSRLKIIDESLKNSAIFVINNINDASKLVNIIAPEHLEIISNSQADILKNISNAGAIFLGRYTPEAIGDYIAGPSHTLPTEGNARFSSGLSVFDFLKRISIIECEKNSFNKISSSAQIIAKSEGLEAHKKSLFIRNEK